MINHWYTQTAEVWRSTQTNGVYGDPERIDISLRCSHVVPTSRSDRERAGLADLVSLQMTYAEASTAPNERPRRDDRLHLDGINYRIRAVLPWPKTDIRFFEVFLEDEGVTA